MAGPEHICIIGLGNPLRGDDGLGHHLCKLVEGLGLPGVDTMQVQQLDTAILPDLARYRQLVVVDAAIQEAPVVFTDTTDPETSANLSHHLQPGIIRGLLKQLFGTDVELKVLRVRGYEFGYGAPLSPGALVHSASAFTLLQDWLAAQGFRSVPGGE